MSEVPDDLDVVFDDGEEQIDLSIATKSVFKAVSHYSEARKEYTDGSLGYDKDGCIKKNGALKGEGLGCSSYVSAVLHRMKYGEDDWLDKYNVQVHQWYGHRIAEHFELAPVAAPHASLLLDDDSRQSLVDNGIVPAALYYFNVRRGVEGHVGFVTIQADGSTEQSHFSSMSKYKGHASGDFVAWLKDSRYSDSFVEIYRMP